MCAMMIVKMYADIDECSGVSPCDQQCTNTQGSFVCSCGNGFQLDDDGSTCNRKDIMQLAQVIVLEESPTTL